MLLKSSLTLWVLHALALAVAAEQTVLVNPYEQHGDHSAWYRFDHPVKKVAVVGAGANCSDHHGMTY